MVSCLLLCATIFRGLVLALAGSGGLVLERLVSLADVLLSRHRAPCLRSACAEVCLEDAACWPLRVGEERGVVGSALGHDPHLRGGDLHYGRKLYSDFNTACLLSLSCCLLLV